MAAEREWATQDAWGIDRIYPGPNGEAMYRGKPILTVERYEEILVEQKEERERIKHAV